ncbi:MAG: hypothetical protein IKB55_04250 [Clostridia bacterium]|nr:hypothetical protein [Clostridia bacterium]
MQKIIIKAETYQEFIDKMLDVVFKEYKLRVAIPYEEEDNSEELITYVWKKEKRRKNGKK